MICFYSFSFIMLGKLIILRTRCFLHQNTSQLLWFKEKNITSKYILPQIKVNYFKGFKAWSAFCCKVAEKARRNSDHPNTKISHRLRNDKCVGFGAKLTLTADEEDGKSIYNHRNDAAGRTSRKNQPKEPAENQKPRFHRLSF